MSPFWSESLSRVRTEGRLTSGLGRPAAGDWSESDADAVYGHALRNARSHSRLVRCTTGRWQVTVEAEIAEVGHARKVLRHAGDHGCTCSRSAWNGLPALLAQSPDDAPLRGR